RILVHSRQSQEQLQAASPDPRGPGQGLLRGHSGDPDGLGRLVLRGDDARHSPGESRPRAPDSALQVLRLPDGLVAGARASAARCETHAAAASAPHRAGGPTYVRSVPLRRRIWRGAVERGILLLAFFHERRSGDAAALPRFTTARVLGFICMPSTNGAVCTARIMTGA